MYWVALSFCSLSDLDDKFQLSVYFGRLPLFCRIDLELTILANEFWCAVCGLIFCFAVKFKY